MLEVVVTILAAAGFGAYVVNAKHKGEARFVAIEKSWETTIMSFAKDNGLEGIDLEFMSKKDLKKKSNTVDSIQFVAQKVDKGFDFIDSKVKSGYKFGPHIHHNSSEFFYVTSGKIRITKCNRNPELCVECSGNCGLYDDNQFNQFNEVHTLVAGDYHYIIPNRFHTFEALEDSSVIVITLPPIGKVSQ